VPGPLDPGIYDKRVHLMKSWILPFKDIGRRDVAVAGGKGANLGELVGEGFPVPPGFVVSAEACHSFFRDIDLEQEVKQLSDSHPDTWGNIVRKFRKKFMLRIWRLRSQMPFSPHIPI
jgi:phosphoenolpyruvate synthase/pyruvate phosphate dikinase